MESAPQNTNLPEEELKTSEEPTQAVEIDERYCGKKYEILVSGIPSILVHYIFHPSSATSGTIECNDTMFNKAPYRVVNNKDFEL